MLRCSESGGGKLLNIGHHRLMVLGIHNADDLYKNRIRRYC